MDLNKDGLLDLVICPNNDWVSTHARRYAFVFWGGRDGWARERMTNLLTIKLLAVQPGDLDADGNQDLVVGVYQTDDTYQVDSRIFYGDGKGGFRIADDRIPTSAVNSFVYIDILDSE